MKALLSLLLASTIHATEVRVAAVPESGMQPQVTVDAAGTAHLAYLRGAPAASDVRYISRAKGASEWSAPIAVNSEPGSAIAMGTIRGAQIAVGQGGSVHVVWNGSVKPDAKTAGSALFYTRLASGTQKFEPQRDLLSGSGALDGGASVGADDKGSVYAVWHGAGSTDGESARVVRVRKSSDNGTTFAAPVIATDQPGVCACCSLRAFAAPEGGFFTLYRAAHTVDQRDMTLLSSRDGAATFRAETVARWAGNMCPMSSAALLGQKGNMRMAWETDGKIFTAMSGGREPLELGKGKHPSLATNTRGETLVVWTTGTAWNRSGSLAWLILDPSGKATAQRGTAPGVPVWSFATAYADEADDFTILR